ncbi:hypothetical protein PROFUN_09344 [Planoprotostelium fungivorum]|uniref:Uncharacterized protein n=1 Tax=Planoprotostelium fungivorum TaxID=1890364 RepID=A0A2P6NGV1_9EUKA|nr:hypothetical protein PROFUN_09344 [Planoprotostelium fungivorum]
MMKNLAARVNIGLGQLKTSPVYTGSAKTHLASQFYSGMSLINYGVLWNLDHCVPVSFAIDNLKALCHYSNIQPMMVAENSSKCADLGLPKGIMTFYCQTYTFPPGFPRIGLYGQQYLLPKVYLSTVRLPPGTRYATPADITKEMCLHKDRDLGVT